jgi:hypothetical protein
MLTQNLATTSKQHSPNQNSSGFSATENPPINKDELTGFTAFFELLSQIDQRLKIEDQDYKKKYYPD